MIPLVLLPFLLQHLEYPLRNNLLKGRPLITLPVHCILMFVACVNGISNHTSPNFGINVIHPSKNSHRDHLAGLLTF